MTAKRSADRACPHRLRKQVDHEDLAELHVNIAP